MALRLTKQRMTKELKTACCWHSVQIWWESEREIKELQQIEIMVILALNEQTMRHVFLIFFWKSRAILSEHRS